MKEKFSVLMSVYHKDDPTYLDTALNSLTEQTAVPDEIVLVKDGPVSQQLEGVIDAFHKKFSNLKIVALEKNSGLGNALNQGLKHCSHELVARMDSDDISKPHRFEKQLHIFETNKFIDVVSSWIDEFIDIKENTVSTRKIPETTEEIACYAKSRCPVNHPSVMFRKSAVLSAGNYQPFPLFEDYYLWARMLLNNAKFYNIQESLLWFRTTSDTYKRRGGLKHAIDEIQFQKFLLKSNFINIPTFFENIAIRFCVRIMPNGLRAFIYKKILRR